MKVLPSAFLAASILAADIVVLTLFLNPEAGLAHDAPGLALALFLPYTLAATLALWLVGILADAIRWWPPPARPPLPPLPWFTTLSILTTAAGAALLWFNLTAYRYSIPLESLRALAGSAVAVSASTLVLLGVAVDALFFPLRGRGAAAPLVVLAAVAAAALPLALLQRLGSAPAPVPLATDPIAPVRRILLVGIDGLGLDQVRTGIDRGQLPVFSRIVKRGAHGPLATLTPTEGPPVWTTIVTGRLPRDHGIKSFTTYRLAGFPTIYPLLPKGAFVGLLERTRLISTRPTTSGSRRRRALWEALNAFGIDAGVVRIWGTHPVERIRGFMLSHYFHVFRDDPSRVRDLLHPPDLLAEVRARAVDPRDVGPESLAPFLELTKDVAEDRVPWRRELTERALAPDMTYQRAGTVLRAAYDPPFFATYFYGQDVVGHAFLRYAQPDRFGDVRPEEAHRYGQVVGRYAAHLGQWVEDLAQGLRPGEILVVVSGYGMEPVSPWRRLLSSVTGDPSVSGTHDGAPDGFIMALGDGVRAGAITRGASVLDVAPTLLYLMGLPVARDMEGRVLTEIVDEGFALAHPVTFIPSYESLAVTPSPAPADDETLPLPSEVR